MRKGKERNWGENALEPCASSAKQMTALPPQARPRYPRSTRQAQDAPTCAPSSSSAEDSAPFPPLPPPQRLLATTAPPPRSPPPSHVPFPSYSPSSGRLPRLPRRPPTNSSSYCSYSSSPFSTSSVPVPPRTSSPVPNRCRVPSSFHSDSPRRESLRQRDERRRTERGGLRLEV